MYEGIHLEQIYYETWEQLRQESRVLQPLYEVHKKKQISQQYTNVVRFPRTIGGGSDADCLPHEELQECRSSKSLPHANTDGECLQERATSLI